MDSMIIQEHQLLWCPIYKAASTNWMKYLIQLSGLDERAVKRLERKFRKY